MRRRVAQQFSHQLLPALVHLVTTEIASACSGRRHPNGGNNGGNNGGAGASKEVRKDIGPLELEP